MGLAKSHLSSGFVMCRLSAPKFPILEIAGNARDRVQRGTESWVSFPMVGETNILLEKTNTEINQLDRLCLDVAISWTSFGC